MNSDQSEPILQSTLVDAPWSLPNGHRLPGTGPIDADDWLRMDDAFAGQMALRDRLIAERFEAVHAMLPEAEAPAREILHMALKILKTRAGYHVAADAVTRPDGVQVHLADLPALAALGRLVQQDICLLQQRENEHALTGAILCFPASWSLAEKIDRPLIGIHEPVDSYTDNIARRVQRLFDVLRVGQPLMRSNCLLYKDASLFQPRRMANRRDRETGEFHYVRSERQCLLRLPETGAVAFSIHTTVLDRRLMPKDQESALAQFLLSPAAHFE